LSMPVQSRIGCTYSSEFRFWRSSERYFISLDLDFAASKIVSTSKSRLEQLDDKDEQEEMLQYSQKEYIEHMETLNGDIAKAWNKEERVKALKMAIQVCIVVCPDRFSVRNCCQIRPSLNSTLPCSF
jgi:hypothetical protein